MNSALLTIDLTKAVADEAIERGDSIIIAYRALNHILPNKARLTLHQA
jgi:putative NIF3 family GTP cyclohydrolase 1 type 2